jgi:putative spermidine/putrescine transport system ATP-binding protein
MTEVGLHGLTKVFQGEDEVKAVNDLDLTIESGKITALLGPSGCGKTTTLKMIAGLLWPTEGDVTFDGRSVLDVPAEKRGAAMVFQQYLLFPYMSVGDNVGFGLRMRHVDREIIDERVAEMLDLVRLPGYQDRGPNQLSGGQQQRVALARALIIEPKVLLLDEPISNLDAHLRDEMRDLILGIQSEFDITMVFVTHDQEEAVMLADQVALIFEGELQQFAEPSAFYERPANEEIAHFFGAVNFLEGLKQGREVKTPLGVFNVNHQDIEDGPVILTVRPENLRIGDEGAENTIEAKIDTCIYLGTCTRLTARREAWSFEVEADASWAKRLCQDDTISLTFPRDNIWLMPRE